MQNVKIIIKNYTEDMELFFNSEKRALKLNLLNDDYVCNIQIEKGKYLLALKKENATFKKHWKREVMFHWISAVCTVPDFALDTVCNGGYRADCIYEIEINEDCEITIDIRYKDIDLKSSNCTCTQLKKEIVIDEKSLKKLRNAYIVPFSIVIGALCLAFTAISFAGFIHGNIWGGAVLLVIAVLIGGVYIYCMKKFLK